MRKLAVLRSDLSLKCPWELPIPNACRKVGAKIDEMIRNPDQIDLSVNLQHLSQLNEGNCIHAKMINNSAVECDAEGNPQMVNESPLYFHPLSGSGLFGMNTFPIGYFNDNVLDRGFYAGMYGSESLLSSSAQANGRITPHTEVMTTRQGNSMPLAKTAQNIDLDGIMVDPEDLEDMGELNLGDVDLKVELEPENDNELEVLSDEPEIDIDGDLEVKVDDLVAKKEFDFTLPNVPGAEDQNDLQVEEDEPEPTDPYKWTLGNFEEWLHNRMQAIPPHSGNDIAGVERAIAYLKWLEGEISKASRQDIKSQLNITSLEKARAEIKRAIKRLDDRLETLQKMQAPKGKKKANLEDGILKLGAEEVPGMVKLASDFYNPSVNIPIFINYIAKVCVNSMVSAGHDAEEVFRKLASKYKMTQQQQVEVLAVLDEWGAIASYRDRGFLPDEDIDISAADNYDWAAKWMS